MKGSPTSFSVFISFVNESESIPFFFADAEKTLS
jgi:hypothetical protein